MDWQHVSSALMLAVNLSLPFIIAAVFAGIFFGVFQAATQIEERSLSFAGRIAAIGVLIYLMGGEVSTRIFGFAERLWGGAEYYF